MAYDREPYIAAPWEESPEPEDPDAIYAPAPWENPEIAEALKQIGPGRPGGGTGASTGFGRRLFQSEGRTWDPAVPYPQISPTPSINPERPRTTAMGYDALNQIVRVTFRDGAVYEYYDVPERVWEIFAKADSPGVFINAFLNAYAYAEIPADQL